MVFKKYVICELKENRIIVDSDWFFDNLCRRHDQSEI